MGEVRWARVNNEPFEYAIQQGSFGDEFVKLLDGSCLRRPMVSTPKWVTDYEKQLLSDDGPSFGKPQEH
jgi:hypothetical protein